MPISLFFAESPRPLLRVRKIVPIDFVVDPESPEPSSCERRGRKFKFPEPKAKKTKDGEFFACALCDSHFSYQQSLFNHVLYWCKHREDKLACLCCNYRARSRPLLYQHFEESHADVSKRYSKNLIFQLKPTDPRFYVIERCRDCNLAVTDQAKLVKHVRQAHCAEERYGCPYCNFSRRHHNSVDRHVSITHPNKPVVYRDLLTGDECEINRRRTCYKAENADERPFDCPYCPYNGKIKQYLTSHIKRKHPGKSFKSLFWRRNHLRTLTTIIESHIFYFYFFLHSIQILDLKSFIQKKFGQLKVKIIYNSTYRVKNDVFLKSFW